MTADLAERALARVVGVDLRPRADTPLTACGVDDDVWVLLAAALREMSGGAVRVRDTDAAHMRTFGDLTSFIARADGGS